MSNIAIRVDNISKRYLIGARKDHHDTFRDHLMYGLASWWRKNGRGENSRENRTLWALKDVSFEVAPGEVVGLIGGNGAGKSTLLKILSRITEPTHGRVELHGRVGSLLEVGTGFHPELSGRENVYLSGAILGMKKWEIECKFDEIVAFAEMDRFIDTPVKRYSSGMYVRLAFAVAAHLQPDILIVDEVLAVGDALFQQKCLGKMNTIATEGRTVLFVSHNLGAIRELCQKAVVLRAGMVDGVCSAREGIDHYLKTIYRRPQASQQTRDESSVMLLDAKTIQAGVETHVVSCAEPFTIRLKYMFREAVAGSRVSIGFTNDKGQAIFGTCDYDDPNDLVLNRPQGSFIGQVTIPPDLLKAGTIYGSVYFDIKASGVLLAAENALQLHVYDPRSTNESERHMRSGVVAPLLQWETNPLPECEVEQPPKYAANAL